jgi:hypothetical protein
MRVLYINPLALGGNPAIDAIAYGLQHGLHAAGNELRLCREDEDSRHQRHPAAVARSLASIPENTGSINWVFVLPMLSADLAT